MSLTIICRVAIACVFVLAALPLAATGAAPGPADEAAQAAAKGPADAKASGDSEAPGDSKATNDPKPPAAASKVPPAGSVGTASVAPRPSSKANGDITFDDLKFEMELGGQYDPSLLTDEIRQLDGKVVKLRGYILPATLFRETNIDEFVLVRDNQECCFGPGAALFDCVVVNLVDGVKTNFTTRPVTVTGTFRLKEYKYPDDSGHFAIFNLQGKSVK